MTSQPFTLRWGILATGGIAEKFAKDLLSDPAARDVADVVHKITAVGSSSDVEKAKKFISEVTGGAGGADITPYGNYEDLVKDTNVDIIYVATPHSHHYLNALSALNAGKHVLCEKPFTVNAKQTAHLIEVARSKKLFLMEAVWTRFFPITKRITQLLHEEKVLGKIHRVFSDFSKYFPPDPKHRMYDPALGGGALLDLGIYAITWAFLTLYHHPDNQGKKPTVAGTIMKHPLTGVDEFTTIALGFENIQASAVVTTSLTAGAPTTFNVLVQGEKGELRVPWPAARPPSYTLQLEGEVEPTTYEVPIPGGGMHWEADACARSIRDGKLEADLCTLSESLAIMEVMDKVREQNGFSYPSPLEDVRA